MTENGNQNKAPQPEPINIVRAVQGAPVQPAPPPQPMNIVQQPPQPPVQPLLKKRQFKYIIAVLVLSAALGLGVFFSPSLEDSMKQVNDIYERLQEKYHSDPKVVINDDAGNDTVEEASEDVSRKNTAVELNEEQKKMLGDVFVNNNNNTGEYSNKGYILFHTTLTFLPDTSKCNGIF